MSNYFISPLATPRNEWWRYLITLGLVISGIIGFGRIPYMIGASLKGITLQELDELSPDEFTGLFSNNENLTYQLFVFVVGFFMLLVAFRFNHRVPWITFFTTRKSIDLKRFFVAFGLWAVIEGIIISIELATNGSTVKWNYNPETFFLLLAICVFLVPIQTGFEELFCRGFVVKWTGKATSRGISIALINGLIFGGLHSMNPEVSALGWFAMVFYIVSGFFAAFLTVMDDGIELSWGYHTANNFFGLLILSSEWQSLQTDSLLLDTSKPSVGWGLIVILGIAYPLMIFLLAKIYRWTDWRKRLLGE
ncbi:MAG TPA: CPBP family intramembrane glutamic endopeptidase [Fluviicola sp.]|nr:CPBP family intramembrane glutamic endopeptidase [Fluviicola sp.]